MNPVKIDKLVHGGQGLGVLEDGRKVFVWGVLPDEEVIVNVIKKRRDYAEAIAVEIIETSPDRIAPIDEAYLSTSPWQIMKFEAENRYKKEILAEAFVREKVEVGPIDFFAGKDQWHYRNKMEYSFWGDDDGLHLALFHRASHGKRIINGSSIARPEIDAVANRVCEVLNTKNVRASQLKTIVLRCNKAGEVVVGLFVKDQAFPEFAELKKVAKGVAVYYSNPKSPASIITSELYKFGSVELSDEIMGQSISYDVNSFFQVNLPVFEKALGEIKKATAKSKNIVDMYSGVGTIGIPLGAKTLVELDHHNVTMADQNSQNSGGKSEVVQASTEQALEYITAGSCIIFDPPRAGLHDKVVDRVLEDKPKTIVYLSCNPATQARDLARLQAGYKIESVTGYNFFPRTPHIESLCVLQLK